MRIFRGNNYSKCEIKMVAKIDLISETSHKHAGEVTALCFDGEHLYSGSEDGVINVRTIENRSVFSLGRTRFTHTYSHWCLILFHFWNQGVE